MAYTSGMNSQHIPAVDPADMLPTPANTEALGPRNEAEARLRDLLLEGLESGSAIRTTLPELMGELRARISKN